MNAPERRYIQDTARSYFLKLDEPAAMTPAPQSTLSFAGRPTGVPLPEWAAGIGVGAGNEIVVDACCVVAGDGPSWTRCDWWRAAFLHVTGAAERLHESHHGPIYSYAGRLSDDLQRLFDHAWVNRIFLFLRRRAAREARRDEIDLCGPLPKARIDLTHDVDAITKTFAVRIKQTTFDAWSGLRLLARGQGGAAAARLAKALLFLFSGGNYRCFADIRAIEETFGVRSTFHFYAGPGGWRRTPLALLMDPSYCVSTSSLAGELAALNAGGWTIGLHQSFGAWRDAEAMRQERAVLERATGGPIHRCRQHWLRFSWADTWRAQLAAGLAFDTTLGFNDRPGLRNGCALGFRPWDEHTRAPMALEALPLVLMDSHLFGHRQATFAERTAEIDHWLGEIVAVGGRASVVWHQRVMSPDYGWDAEYRYLLSALGAAGGPGGHGK